MKGKMNGLRRVLSIALSLSFLFQQVGLAQTLVALDVGKYFPGVGRPVVTTFRPLQLRYFSYDFPANTFDFFLDKGDVHINDALLNDQAKPLLDYFLVGITLPNDSFWVNLRPDSEAEITDELLSKTDVGKVMLEADLQLKKDIAQATSPSTPAGKLYWNKLYQKAGELFGQQAVTIPTLTRPWIVPGEVIVRYTADSAYIYKSTLKVMLEQDYLKESQIYNFKDERLKTLNEYSSQLVRELILPELTKQVNTDKRYANLRQVFSSLILAQCFKMKFNTLQSQYKGKIDSKDLSGLTSKNYWSKSTYFNAYKDSFEKGEYNVKEPVSGPYGQVIRSYFSGGVSAQVPAGAFVAGGDGADFGCALARGGNGVGVQMGPDGRVGRGYENRPDVEYRDDIRAALAPPRKYGYDALSFPFVQDPAALFSAENRSPQRLKELMEPVLRFFGENALLVQAGKDYRAGKAVQSRTASLVNKIWTYMLRFEDELAYARHWNKKANTQRAIDAVMSGDLSTYVECLIEYVTEFRNPICQQGILLAIDAHEGRTGLPRYAYELAQMIFEGEDEDLHVIRDLYNAHGGRNGGRAYFETNNLYTLDAIDQLVADGLEEGVAVFALGAGGPGSNLLAISKEGKAHLIDFLRGHGIESLDSAEAQAQGRAIVNGEAPFNNAAETHTLKGYMECRFSLDGMKISLVRLNERGEETEEFDLDRINEECPAILALRKAGKDIRIRPPEPPKWVLVDKQTGEIIREVSANEDVEYNANQAMALFHESRQRFNEDGSIIFDQEDMDWIKDQIDEQGLTEQEKEQLIAGIMNWLEAEGLQLKFDLPLRLVDTSGSSQDLPEFQKGLTPEADRVPLEEIPGTPTIASLFRATIYIGKGNNPNSIDYVAADYFPGVYEGTGVNFARAHTDSRKAKAGVQVAEGKQKDAPMIYFQTIFGIKGGILVTCKELPFMARAGGMESSNAANVAIGSASSMLSGANLREAELFVTAVVLENGTLDGLTGGQGHLCALRGGAYLHKWLSGIFDMLGQRQFAACNLQEGRFAQGALHIAKLQPKTRPTSDAPYEYEVVEYDVEPDLQIALDASQIARLNGAIATLKRENGGHFYDIDELMLVFLPFSEGKTGHYSLGRKQIFLDISLLDADRQVDLISRLGHEVRERSMARAALAQVPYKYTDGQTTSLLDVVEQTTLHPVARETMLILSPSARRALLLADYLDTLTASSHEELVDPIQLLSDEELAPLALDQKGFAGSVAFYTTNFKGWIGGEAFCREHNISDQQVEAAAVRIFFYEQTQREGKANVRIVLADIHPAFAEFEDTIDQFLALSKGGIPAQRRPGSGVIIPTLPTGGTPANPGGIDFRYIGMMTQFQASSFKSSFKMPELSQLKKIEPAKEKGELEKLLAAGIIPSSQRVTDYIAACYLKFGTQKGAEEAIGCLSKLFRLEEETVVATDTQLKSFLFFMESSAFAR